MNTISKIILVAAAAGSLLSCNKWLDIMPEDTTTENQLFSNSGGYHTAINGLYQTMASSDLYGENLTWGFVSALSQYYENANASNSKNFSYTEKYEYASDEVKAFGEQIWQTAYNVIANSNNILQHIATADPSMFAEYEKCEMDVIKGEALAVRGLMHFELLRLFATAPSVDLNASAIPYVKVYPTTFSSRETVKGVIDNVIADFTEAADLLAKNDTTSGYSRYYMGAASDRYRVDNSSRNYFFTGRGSRLNFVAVKSLMARAYAYAGQLDKAEELASWLIANYSEKNSWYTFTKGFSDSDTEKSRPHKLIDELLVSFYDENLSTAYSQVASKGVAYNSYAIKNIDGIFGDNDDYRKKLLSVIDVDTKVSLKYQERSGSTSVISMENKLLPVMRLSELYFIKIEFLARNGRTEEAAELLNKFRVDRGCFGNKIASDADMDTILSALDSEVWRDNVAEGQYFFFCKKNNAATINNNGVRVDMNGKYTMVIPDSEISLN